MNKDSLVDASCDIRFEDMFIEDIDSNDLNVSVHNELLHDEKSHFAIDKSEMNIDSLNMQHSDKEVFDENDDLFDFRLNDGILYSIILEKRWL